MSTEAAIQDTSTGFTLPIFVTRERKSAIGVAMFTVAAAMYLLSNHFHFAPPIELERGWADLAMPFVPETIWLYLSEYILFVAVYLVSNDMRNLNKFVYSFLALQLVSGIIFCAWPTTYPRGLFPLVAGDMDAATYHAFSTLRQTDTPANCCPSLHVSSVFLASFVFLDEQRKYFAPFFLWGVGVAVSTMTTKQHYLVDVVSGLLLAIVMYWFFHKRVKYRS